MEKNAENYLISVLLTNYNTLDFINLSLLSLRRLTNNKYKVLINDNGSRKIDILGLKKITYENKNVIVNYRKSKYKFEDASYAHAEALDILINMVDTEYTVVLDSDCVFLLKDWDKLLISKINNTVKIIGTPLPEGRSGLKPYNFPFQFGVLFDTKTYKNLKISCMPRDILKGEDTCWEWFSKFTNNGYKGVVFTVKNTRDYHEGPFKNLICEEYYIENGKLIASHFGRGSSGGIVKYYHKWYFNMPIVSRITKKYAATKQKKLWMEKCYNLIVNQ